MKPQEKLIAILLFAFLLFSTTCLAQDDDYRTSPDSTTKPVKKSSRFDWKKVYMGGGLGLQFGYTTVVDISPTIGYRFNENLSAGLGLTYLYYEISSLDYQTNVYGGGPFVRYVFARNLFAHVEYQILNAEYYKFYPPERQDVHYFWVGGGFRRQLGGNAYLVLMGLYDLNYSDLSIYPTNPILRVGVVVGL
ncbi:MAG TPA: hypothetical protein EYN71_01290 [Flavobacteriales bacterium]|nr:hypothetical protein [Flavobacteriales bacterium]